MAKHNKSQAERNTTSKRKRSCWGLFKFRRSGNESPTPMNVRSNSAYKNNSGMTVMGSDNNPGLTQPQGTTMHADNQAAVNNPANDGANYSGTIETAAGMLPKTVIPPEATPVNMPASNESPAHEFDNQTLVPPDLLTLADINNESKMSPVRKAALQTWKSLHKLTEVIEPFLEGTPFKGPVSVFNVISSAAESAMDNKEQMEKLSGDIMDYLQIINEALLKGIAKDQCTKFAG
ncbi:hypothetical protein GYMLUDRAFT_250268 [Collybiopsis luxurians FD-317 M1]|uniref:Unplaced genomic scaffold GYMLUscaffold_79, whole genome shotgun sequence n=1 Tax=Collybiopsis luxurians FD-317 M1 TaxID=944289 RepID=A0A0D0BVB8_9AGAR|nr:hypothetical protein GYMLUDRAFT_250268 [Collybiopsis luxurians FD-317 M1]